MRAHTRAAGARWARRWAPLSDAAAPPPHASPAAERNQQLAVYAASIVIGVVGLSYASVPLYQMFCQATGYGGTTQKATEEQFKNMKPVSGGGVGAASARPEFAVQRTRAASLPSPPPPCPPARRSRARAPST